MTTMELHGIATPQTTARNSLPQGGGSLLRQQANKANKYLSLSPNRKAEIRGEGFRLRQKAFKA